MAMPTSGVHAADVGENFRARERILNRPAHAPNLVERYERQPGVAAKLSV